MVIGIGSTVPDHVRTIKRWGKAYELFYTRDSRWNLRRAERDTKV